MKETSQLYVFGAGGHAREVAWIANAAGWRVAAFLLPPSDQEGRLGSIETLFEDRIIDLPARAAAVIGIGDPMLRQRLAQRWEGRVTWVSLRHPTATVAPDANLCAGSVLFPQSVVGPGVTIGQHVVINTGASISHDGVIEEYALLGPGARLAGHVSIGARAFIGCGAVTRAGTPEAPLRIGHDAVVGAGAAVVADVKSKARVVGVPARPMRDIRLG